MKPIPPPVLSVEIVAASCSNIDDPMKAARFTAAIPHLTTHEASYLAAGFNQSIMQQAISNMVGARNCKDLMIWVYQNKLAKKAGAARPYYDRLRATTRICPYCRQRKVWTLDHYLGKASYCRYAITPANLVPCCRDCNSQKEAFMASQPLAETVHPYFDDYSDAPWLRVQVGETALVPMTYSIAALPGWSTAKHRKLQSHFDVFGLYDQYEEFAVVEMQNQQDTLSRLRQTEAGASAVRAHLAEQASTHSVANPNSWQSALYAATRDSDWFCSMGCTLLPRP